MGMGWRDYLNDPPPVWRTLQNVQKDRQTPWFMADRTQADSGIV